MSDVFIVSLEGSFRERPKSKRVFQLLIMKGWMIDNNQLLSDCILCEFVMLGGGRGSASCPLWSNSDGMANCRRILRLKFDKIYKSTDSCHDITQMYSTRTYMQRYRKKLLCVVEQHGTTCSLIQRRKIHAGVQMIHSILSFRR